MKYEVTIGGLDMKTERFECVDALGVALLMCDKGYPKNHFNRLVCDIEEYTTDDTKYLVMFPTMYVNAEIKLL